MTNQTIKNLTFYNKKYNRLKIQFIYIERIFALLKHVNNFELHANMVIKTIPFYFFLHCSVLYSK